MFVLRSPAEKCATTLECVSLESDLTIARFDMTECEVKTDKDTLVLQMPNAVPVILQPPADEYERWKHVLRQVWFVELPTTTFCQSCSFFRIPPFFYLTTRDPKNIFFPMSMFFSQSKLLLYFALENFIS